MKAITVEPSKPGTARLEDVPEPEVRDGSVLVEAVAAGGVVCLTGVGRGGRMAGPPTADIAAQIVLQNNVVVGSVNANKRHWYKAGEALARADRSWLKQLLTRCERPEDFARSLERKPDDIKIVVQFAEA